jgi:RNA polymerase sigma factor (sigma-70 family)
MNDSIITRTDNIQRYFRELKNEKYKPLADSVIREMFFSDRNKYRDRIINSHIRLVATIAKDYDHKNNFMDYNQVGLIGLMEAIDKYDPSSDAKFSTYAAYWIKARMSMSRHELEIVQRSNRLKLGSKVTKFQEKFLKENLREATTEEIKDYLSEVHGIDVHCNHEIYKTSVTNISDELNDDGMTSESVGEFARMTSSENGYVAKMEQEDLAEHIGKMMSILTPKEKEYITRHVINEESYSVIAYQEGYTTERVRQIIVGGLKKMKGSAFAEKYFSRFLK